MKSFVAEMFRQKLASLRLAIVTMLACVAGYTAIVLGFAQVFVPSAAEGSLIKNGEDKIIGSRLIAQNFTNAVYFWPRPSAVGYNAAGAGGSNKSPTSRDLADRARQLIAQHGASSKEPLPAELATASGSGLDPHITERAALFQVERVAQARGLSQHQVESLVEQHTFAPGRTLVPDRLVNVLELNLALDALTRKPR
jgi:K+-transporting ATPase ATPase C chain